MSLNELLSLSKKPWCNIEVEDLHVDGTLYCNSFIPPLPGSTGSTGAGSVYFTSVCNTSQNNLTGDGTTGELIYDTIIRQTGGSNYNSTTGVFTAPINGLYQFNTSVLLSGVTGSTGLMTAEYYYLVGGVVKELFRGNISNLAQNNSGEVLLCGSVSQYMSINQTCQPIIIVSGGNKTVNHLNGETDFFDGYLVSIL